MISKYNFDKRIIYRNTLRNMWEATLGNPYAKGTFTPGASLGFIDVAGRRGLDFDGANSTLVTDLRDNSVFQGGFTISAWIYPRTTGEGGAARIIEKSVGDLAATGGFFFAIFTNNTLILRINAGTTVSTANNAITLNTLQHVLVTISANGTVTFYINGIQSGSSVVSGALSGIATSNPLTIGNHTGGTDRTWDGMLSDLQILRGAFTAEEAKLFYKNALYKEIVPLSGMLLDANALDGVLSDKTGRYTLTPSNILTVNYGGIWTPNFNGANSTLVTDLTDNSVFQNGFSIEAWLRVLPGGAVAEYDVVNKSNNVNGSAGFQYYFDVANMSMQARLIGSTIKASVNNSISYGKWYHVVVTFGADTTITHYINGVQSGTPGTSGAFASITTSNPLMIGATNIVTASNYFKGYLPRTRITTRIYSAEEVSNLFNSSRGRYGV